MNLTAQQYQLDDERMREAIWMVIVEFLEWYNKNEKQ